MSKLLKSTALTILCLWTFSDAKGQGSNELPADLIQRDTMLVAHIDLDQIEVDPLLRILNKFGLPTSPSTGAEATNFLNELRSTGTSRYYLTVPTEWISNGAWCAIMPTENPSALAEMIRKTPFVHTPHAHALNYVFLEQEKRIVICPKAMEQRFSGKTERAMQSMLHSVPSGYPHWLSFSLPDALRPALAAIFPDQLPANMGIDFSPSAFAYNVRGITLGWSLLPELKMELVIEGNGSKGAVGAKAQLEKLLSLANTSSITAKPTITEDDRVIFKVGASEALAIVSQLKAKTAGLGAAQATQSSLKQIGLAIFNYIDQEGRFPKTAIQDENGRPLLSWRVALLPLLNQEELYNKFKLDEPWDSPHNKQLLAEMPAVFADPMSNQDPTSGMTRYRLPVMPGSIWSAKQPIHWYHITDGLSNTIMAAFAPSDKAVEWTRPDDWTLSEANLVQDFFGASNETTVTIADGGVRPLKKGAVTPNKLKAFLQYADGNPFFIP